MLIKNGRSAINCLPFVIPDEAMMNRMIDTPGEPSVEYPETSLPVAETTKAPAAFSPIVSEAAAVIEQARQEAEQIISDAHRRANEIERNARALGIKEGRASLAGEVAGAVEPLREQLAGTINTVAGLREQLSRQAEGEMVQLAIEIAKKIVRREVMADREIVLSLARVTLGRLNNRTMARLRLHPDDYQYLIAHRERLGSNAIELIEDSAITHGGCLIETELGDIDARIEQQFNEIENGLLSV